ncbi:MAG: hypothetical protein IPI49_33645 [Myxococcales bacterium]|nr:hypothetical protein [Myxococcales bacterium]
MYLAFRFDVRFAPPARFAAIHDAVMVVGVFSITWQEVSLTTVAAVLTVGWLLGGRHGWSSSTASVRTGKAQGQRSSSASSISRSTETLVRSILTSLAEFAATLVHR